MTVLRTAFTSQFSGVIACVLVIGALTSGTAQIEPAAGSLTRFKSDPVDLMDKDGNIVMQVKASDLPKPPIEIFVDEPNSPYYRLKWNGKDYYVNAYDIISNIQKVCPTGYVPAAPGAVAGSLAGTHAGMSNNDKGCIKAGAK